MSLDQPGRIDMRFISVFKHGPSQRHPMEAEGKKKGDEKSAMSK
jgi:hypothetical protein